MIDLNSSVDDKYLTDEHRMLRAMVREFARNEIEPVAGALDREARFPWENVAKMAELGLFGVPWPEEYGGVGMDTLASTLVAEELSKVCPSHSITVVFAVRPLALGIALVGSGLARREWVAAAWFGPKGFASMIYGLLILNTAAAQGPHLFHLVALVILGSIILHSSTDVTVARWFRPSQSRPAEN